MSDPDPKTTLREFRDYVAVTYEANHKIAARIGVTVKTFAEWLTGDRQPIGKSLEKLRAFLDAEAKRSAGNGIKPIERVPLKIVWPRRQLHYARLCPFCRKDRGKVRKLGATSFQGVCPKCGATVELLFRWTISTGFPFSSEIPTLQNQGSASNVDDVFVQLRPRRLGLDVPS